MKKTFNKTARRVALAFSLAVGSQLIPGSTPQALAFHPESSNPIGLWQAAEHNMIAEVEKCPDTPAAICATVYRTSNESVNDALKREKERALAGRPPENHIGQTSNFCTLFEKTRATESSLNNWDSEKISHLFLSARLNVRMIDNDHASGIANIRLFGFDFSNINMTAQRISPNGPEFTACRELKKRPVSNWGYTREH